MKPGPARFSLTGDKERAMSESENMGINSKKKDLSDQLRQISQKIDK